MNADDDSSIKSYQNSLNFIGLSQMTPTRLKITQEVKDLEYL